MFIKMIAIFGKDDIDEQELELSGFPYYKFLYFRRVNSKQYCYNQSLRQLFGLFQVLKSKFYK